MRKKGIIKLLLGGAACAALFSCEPEGPLTAYGDRSGTADGNAGPYQEMSLSIIPLQTGDTKASLLKDVESKGSGALVLIFRSATGRLDSYRFFSQAELDAQQTSPLKLRVPLTKCDFFILGNLNGIRKSDAKAVNLMTALGSRFPVEESELEEYLYRLDGGSLNDTYRRERFAEVARYGIPYMHVSKQVDTPSRIAAGLGIPGSDQCVRLFSKVTVRIDHSALDGDGAYPDCFVNEKLYLRQANGSLQPFSQTPRRASEVADVLAESDYDPEMASTNASVTTFSFYVPENMQGTLLPDNQDSAKKTRDQVIAAGGADAEPYLTYVEFSATADPSLGGYGGDVTYRFYLGADNTGNFDLVRGREYEISLTFRVGSLFSPDWKVQVDNWQDDRLFCLTADPAFTDRLADGKMVAVRSNRPGGVYLYMNPGGSLGGTNALLGKEAASSQAFTPESLADCAWYGDLMKSGSTAGKWLKARGISPSWDKAAGRLRLEVTDPSRFSSHLGEEKTFSLKLLPGGTSVKFKLRLCPDISVTVADGKSLTDEFYLGQKRSLTLSGFSGKTLCYAADQDPCGKSSSGQAHTANVQWKSSADASAAFPTAKLDASGNILLKTSEYASQRLSGGSLDVYAFYPNRFLSSHKWTSKSGRILFFSDDYLNDSFEVDVRISEPVLYKPSTTSGAIVLPIDGTEQAVPSLGYRSFDGKTALARDSFDEGLYASLLALKSSYASSSPYLKCVHYDESAGTLSIRRTEISSGKLEDLEFGNNYCASLGAFYIKANTATGLYSGNVFRANLSVSKLYITDFVSPSTGIGYFSSGTNSVPIDQFTDDEVFTVPFKYYFRNGDLGRIRWERSGLATSYTCPGSGEVVGPVIEVQVETDDAGAGGRLLWTYDESHQVMRSASGEMVPGGLIIPYGPQTVKATVTNKWDNRTFTVSSDFVLRYATPMAVFVAANRSRYASVYVIPQKNVKYLKRMASSVGHQGRQWMLKLLGTDGWYEKTRASSLYQRTTGMNQWYRTGPVRLPVTDYDVKYLSGASGFTPGSVWSQAAIDAVESKSLYVVNDFPSTPSDGEWGSEYIYGSGLAIQNAWNEQKGVFLNSTEAF
ncbi:MAG: DUF4906 domain-containing protein [Bacteroidales bacterium]|nr:DUF4906 domain-containing protein [Bacteroidales bacterium]